MQRFSHSLWTVNVTVKQQSVKSVEVFNKNNFRHTLILWISMLDKLILKLIKNTLEPFYFPSCDIRRICERSLFTLSLLRRVSFRRRINSIQKIFWSYVYSQSVNYLEKLEGSVAFRIPMRLFERRREKNASDFRATFCERIIFSILFIFSKQ